METLPNDRVSSDVDPLTIPPSGIVPDAIAPQASLPPQPTTAMVRVLHVINGEYYAGAERVQDLLAKCLPQFGFSAGFACVKLDLFDSMRESRDAPLYKAPMWSRFDLRAARHVAGIVRRDHYQIVHAHTVRTAMVAAIAARLAGVPFVYHAHSPMSQNTTHRWRNRMNAVVERLSLCGVSQIIAVSEAMAEHMVRAGIDRDRITVVLNGVPSLASPPERRVPVGSWTLGTIALFRPRKGLEVLLEALAILRRQNVPVHLRAVGPFESRAYEAEIAGHVRRLGLGEHVSWVGFTRDVAGEMQKMDLFVLPSLFGEGLPMVLLEAMAAGVPIVASRVPGVPEAIRDGHEGLLVSPGDAGELAWSVARVVDGDIDWSRLRTHALARQAQQFSDRSMAAGVAAVYRNVLDRDAPTRL